MLRELLTGLAVVFMASSVIISNIFRNTRPVKPPLPAKNVSDNASITDKRNIPAPEPGSNEPNPKSADV